MLAVSLALLLLSCTQRHSYETVYRGPIQDRPYNEETIKEAIASYLALHHSLLLIINADEWDSGEEENARSHARRFNELTKDAGHEEINRIATRASEADPTGIALFQHEAERIKTLYDGNKRFKALYDYCNKNLRGVR